MRHVFVPFLEEIEDYTKTFRIYLTFRKAKLDLNIRANYLCEIVDFAEHSYFFERAYINQLYPA